MNPESGTAPQPLSPSAPQPSNTSGPQVSSPPVPQCRPTLGDTLRKGRLGSRFAIWLRSSDGDRETRSSGFRVARSLDSTNCSSTPQPPSHSAPQPLSALAPQFIPSAKSLRCSDFRVAVLCVGSLALGLSTFGVEAVHPDSSGADTPKTASSLTDGTRAGSSKVQGLTASGIGPERSKLVGLRAAHLGFCNTSGWNPNNPLVPCCKLPTAFRVCKLLDCSSDNDLVLMEGGLEVQCDQGCEKYGGSETDPVSRGSAICTSLEGVPCLGPTSFIVPNYPCIKYSGHRFPTAILLSVFLGWAGADRFYLGYIGWGIFKLLTLGGLGIWWFLDIVLLLVGSLSPSDSSSWDS